MNRTVTASAGPSLALIKYWGKQSKGINIPACTSVAVTLDALQSTARIEEAEQDQLILNGRETPVDYLAPVLAELRKTNPKCNKTFVQITASNNFPTGAGLASSASGIAACSAALAEFYNANLSVSELSKLARLGSGSACRSVFGGFTQWKRNSEYAEVLAPKSHWKELRIIVFILSTAQKPMSSRQAMLACAVHSPYYKSWLTYNLSLVRDTVEAIESRDLEKLGRLMRSSYSAMHATMLASNPPLLYWLPESIELITLAKELRSQQLPVWETMDAGPQVKYLTELQYVQPVLDYVRSRIPTIEYRVCNSGPGARLH